MQGLLIDLDGVIYDSRAGIPGAAQVIRWLESQTIPFLFVTNTSSKPRQAIVEKLADLNINIPAGQILTPPVAARSWLKAHCNGPIALFIPEQTQAEFSGFEILKPGTTNGAAAVVVGDMGENWAFDTLNRAFQILMDDSAPVLIALGMTRYWRAPAGLQLDAAPFVKALEYASDCHVQVLGKPSQDFFDAAVNQLRLPPSEILMIGDDLMGDVKGAQDSGLKGALVKTGKFLPKDLQSNVKPDWVLDSIAQLPEKWGEIQSSK